ncbi:MAG: hypothetical protein D6814_18240 [Calditrichaeota bacterium]|nr:MAG: hypothetical protein D6814_18240 [Calditrichota bacterium]
MLREAIKHLIHLQQIDQQLDELERAKGDLPQKVQELEARLASAKQDLSENQGKQEDVQKEKRRLEREISTLQDDKKRYEEQLYAVTTNREYDAVTQEIETAIQKIDEKETELLQLIEQEESLQQQAEEFEQQIAQLEENFESQSAILNEKIAANAEQEKKLQQERAVLLQHIKKQHLQLYEKIRSKKDGLAVVPILRNSCGGCYTYIPPQRSMEIRDGDKLIVCESCGRILYWQEQQESVSTT